MPDLDVQDFAAYFKAVHGDAPFAWQSRLLKEVVQEGRWPDLLDLPTGSGKTAAIDVALFHLALDGGRRAPRRIVIVVDRRTVVDQAFRRAEHVAKSFETATHDVVRNVAARLTALTAGEGSALAAAQLRGGMPRDDGWARRPDQPLVAVSTVDQVGSRLLFRGYGLSDGMRSIHAGLLGQDTLFLLDEVHLSEPFRETLESLARYRSSRGTDLPNRWQVVAMSATPGEQSAGARRFSLGEEDESDARLMRRLRTSKPVTLAPEVKVSGLAATKHATFAKACAEQAAKLARPGRTVGVVVNRVDSARETYAILRSRFERVFLVTGRMRPLDRDQRDVEVQDLVRSGRSRDPSAEPVVVVATQCIEAGADYDFDALVTECASLDALRQRFGRLNRRGEIDDASAVVLARSDSLAKEKPDPVYGDALAATWEWLKQSPRDFGVRALDEAMRSELAEVRARLLAPHGRAPVMLPSHLDAWSQTRPAPFPDPDVSLWLHGIDQRSQPEVQVVWRADIREEMLVAQERESDAAAKARRSSVFARLEACAPVGLEAISLPLYAVRAWLSGEPAVEMADVEGGGAPDEDQQREESKPRPVVRWRGDDICVVHPDDLQPGDTLVVPSEYGGLTDGTWDPNAEGPVMDLGHQARWRQTRRPVLRLLDAVLPSPPLPAGVSPAGDGGEDDRELARDWLERATEGGPSPLGEVVAALKRSRYAVVRIDPFESEGQEPLPGYLVLVGRRREKGGAEGWAEDDGASLTGVEVSLTDHMRGVEDWARRFSANCGISGALAEDVALAARWHDAGKADVRFQRMLRGPRAFLAEGTGELLAKSATPLGDRAAREKAREASGYPRGARHELSSVALLVEQESLLSKASDRDLVLHLVASHHGWCRPFAPVAHDTEPVLVELDIDGERVRVESNHGLARLDSGISERFWRMTDRYGWYGLAWLESLLRLADHRRSEHEQRLTEAKQ